MLEFQRLGSYIWSPYINIFRKCQFPENQWRRWMVLTLPPSLRQLYSIILFTRPDAAPLPYWSRMKSSLLDHVQHAFEISYLSECKHACRFFLLKRRFFLTNIFIWSLAEVCHRSGVGALWAHAGNPIAGRAACDGGKTVKVYPTTSGKGSPFSAPFWALPSRGGVVPSPDKGYRMLLALSLGPGMFTIFWLSKAHVILEKLCFNKVQFFFNEVHLLRRGRPTQTDVVQREAFLSRLLSPSIVVPIFSLLFPRYCFPFICQLSQIL